MFNGTRTMLPLTIHPFAFYQARFCFPVRLAPEETWRLFESGFD
jgi:hypothetical protein